MKSLEKFLLESNKEYSFEKFDKRSGALVFK